MTLALGILLAQTAPAQVVTLRMFTGEKWVTLSSCTNAVIYEDTAFTPLSEMPAEFRKQYESAYKEERAAIARSTDGGGG